MSTPKKCIVKNSKTIRAYLSKRMEQIGMKPFEIVRDAKEKGLKIDNASFSRFMKDGAGGISQENILWLCLRWGINIQLLVGTPKIIEGRLKIELPSFNEEEALKTLKKIFP